jgi:microcystin-dependent protein
MAEPFIGEVKMVGFNFAPVGWAPCDGRLLPIAQYDALFALLGTTYGGDGQTTFALPDLRSRAPMHPGSGHPLGEMGGAETVTLNVNQLPAHGHVPQASSAGAARIRVPAGSSAPHGCCTPTSTVAVVRAIAAAP